MLLSQYLKLLDSFHSRSRRLLSEYARKWRFEIITGMVIILSLVYLGSIGIGTVTGATATLNEPSPVFYLSIINASGDNKKVHEFTQFIGKGKWNGLRISVVGNEEFAIHEAPETIVVARVRDRSNALIFARMIGLDEDRVIFKELENNRDHLTATLIAGRDFSFKSVDISKLKEKISES